MGSHVLISHFELRTLSFDFPGNSGIAAYASKDLTFFCSVQRSAHNKTTDPLNASLVVTYASMNCLAILLALAALLFRRVPAQESMLGPRGSSLDPSSYSNVEQFQPQHLSFQLEVDFDQSSVVGTVTHTLTSLDKDAVMVYMDVWDGLSVETAEFWTATAVESCPSNTTTVPFEVSTPNPNIGNALDVELPCSLPAGSVFYLRFSYITNPDNWAMSWLTPSQTAGQVLPYMYSLCQMNFCRDFAPMMDTPSQKITYDATVVAPSEFVVRMSANTTGETALNDTHTLTSFNATIKIPSYLIAIVVGDLEERRLSNRVSVISEPAYLEAAVEEFEELPEILDIIEDYLIPYLWGKYTIAIMPPSFPWGGMVRLVTLLKCKRHY